MFSSNVIKKNKWVVDEFGTMSQTGSESKRSEVRFGLLSSSDIAGFV